MASHQAEPEITYSLVSYQVVSHTLAPQRRPFMDDKFWQGTEGDHRIGYRIWM